jgi:hypothetical protein
VIFFLFLIFTICISLTTSLASCSSQARPFRPTIQAIAIVLSFLIGPRVDGLLIHSNVSQQSSQTLILLRHFPSRQLDLYSSLYTFLL